MHMHFHAHDKNDQAKLNELLHMEAGATGGGGGDAGENKIEEPRPGGVLLEQKIEFIFNVINFLNSVVAAVFLSVALIYAFQNGQLQAASVLFGTEAFKRVSSSLALNSICLLTLSWLGLLSRRRKQQLLLYVILGTIMCCALAIASSTALPNNATLLSNVSDEMASSMAAYKKGAVLQKMHWDVTQFTLQCCGISAYTDWCENKNGSQVACVVPKSCFANNSKDPINTIHPEIDPYTPINGRGCYTFVTRVLHTDLTILRSFAYILNFLMGFATIYASVCLWWLSDVR